ncbi:MAG: Crp/Fnr family transcriptional regulator [Anaerolineae bacterium]|nr:Crp/Fnr family transcriptional regulator [Anaerolineae bacterium]
MTTIREALLACALFADLPDAALDALSGSLRWQHVERGEVLFNQGDEAAFAYLVTAGRLRLVQHTLEGKDVTMATFTSTEVIGLIVVLLGEQYPGTAEALDNAELIVLPAPPLWGLLNTHPAFSLKVIHMLADRLHEAHNRIRELSAERVQRRVARSLLRLVEKVGVAEGHGAVRLDIRLSRQDLAQMNGTTLETISRTLSAWEDDGIVESAREQIVILRPHALVRVADDLPM